MKLLKYELKKIFGIRYVYVLLLLFLILNGIVASYMSSNYSKNMVDSQTMNEIILQYIASPEIAKEKYNTLLQLKKEKSEYYNEQVELGNYDVAKAISFQSINEDLSAYKELFDRIDYIHNYSDVIQVVIDQAEYRIAEFNNADIGQNTFYYKYQEKIISLYKEALNNVNIGLEYNRGWDKYFEYDIVNIFIFAMLLVIGSILIPLEVQEGFLPIMRICKNGRASSIIVKILTMVIMTTSVTFLFTLETWLIFAYQIGYSNPFNAIQVFEDFVFCPYILTILEYFLYITILKLITFIFFSVIVMVISVFTPKHAVIYISGIGIIGFNLFLYSTRLIDTNNPLKYLNFIATGTCTPLLERYRAVNVFGNVIGYIPFCFVSFIFLSYVGILILVLKYIYGKETGSISKRAFDYPQKRKREIKWNKREYYFDGVHSLLFIELHKILFSTKHIVIVMILLLLKCYLAGSEVQMVTPHSDSVYKEYMTVLAGEITEQKRQYLIDERERINGVLNEQTTIRQAYLSEQITYDEYRAYLNEYNYAYYRNSYLVMVENHLTYIDQLASEGISAWFVYDTGWKVLFFAEFDWTLYVVLLLLFSGVFIVEYDNKTSSGGFQQILRVTRNGRSKTFISKYIAAITIAFIVCLIWNLIDVIYILSAYDLPLMEAPLQSIEAFRNIKVKLSIYQYILLFYILRIISTLLVTTLIVSLSVILHKYIAVMSSTVVITLFPALFSYFDLTIFEKVDYTAFMRVTPMFIQGNTIVIFIIISMLINMVGIFKAERMWNK